MKTQFGDDKHDDDDKKSHSNQLERVDDQVRPRPAATATTGSSPQSIGGSLLEVLLRILHLAIGSLVWTLARLATRTVAYRHGATSLANNRSLTQLESKPRREQTTTTSSTRDTTETRERQAAARLTRIAPVQMSQQVVPGFEEQQVAHELSALVIEEALNELLNEPMAAGEPNRNEPGNADEEQASDPKPNGKDNLADVDSLGSGSEQEQEHGQDRDRKREEEEGEDNDDDQDEHCGRQASKINLRQIRLSTLEDVLVCDQRRHETHAARSLFNQLAVKQSHTGGTQKAPMTTRTSKRLTANGANQRCNSLSSRSSHGAPEINSDDDNSSLAGSNHPLDIDYLDELLGRSSQAEDCGTIKLDRRCCSSSSSSSVNFGRTLVCSVSPTGQFNLDPINSSSNNNNTNNNPNYKTLNIHELGDALNRESAEHNDDNNNNNLLNYYPINGDEVRQCRTAFRENRRLIEQAQMDACRAQKEPMGARALSRSASQATMQTAAAKGQNTTKPDRTRWADSLGRRSGLPECARCHQKLYPIDKLDLDFARATLNIHRNCFKCQVCATLLRLETYASIDTKLYCPAHVKCVTPAR